MMEIRHIIWDFDGTLFDTYRAITKAFQQTLYDNYNVVKDASDIYELCKIDTKHCAAVLAKEYKIDEHAILSSARHNYDRMTHSEQTPFPSVRNICKTLQNNQGTNFIITHRDRKSLTTHLKKHHFDLLFTEIVTRDDPFPEKPSPESFSYLIKKHQLNRRHTVGIGDRDIDILAANAAGITSIFFCGDLKTSPHANLNISHFTQLLKYV